jgi:hypothetical protein
MDASTSNLARARLSVQTVERLHRLLGGDAHIEHVVLAYIEYRWKAESLFYIPEKIAREILKRPDDFLKAVRRHSQPELGL